MFKGIELSCLVDTGSQVTTVDKSVYDACFLSTIQRDQTTWVILKATNNSPNEKLGVMQLDIDLWGRTV